MRQNPERSSALIGNLSDTSLSGTPKIVDFTLSSPYVLAPNLRYWIVLNTTDRSSANWAYSLDQTAIGVAGELFGHGTSVFSNVGGPFQMRLSDTAVPEPSTWFLGLLSCCVLAARRWIAK